MVFDISLSCEFVVLFESALFCLLTIVHDATGLCACVCLCTLGKDITDTGSDMLRT